MFIVSLFISSFSALPFELFIVFWIRLENFVTLKLRQPRNCNRNCHHRYYYWSLETNSCIDKKKIVFRLDCKTKIIGSSVYLVYTVPSQMVLCTTMCVLFVFFFFLFRVFGLRAYTLFGLDFNFYWRMTVNVGFGHKFVHRRRRRKM